jgi:CBS domain-containing protein
LAELVADSPAIRVEGDLKNACITNRANVLVTAKAASFELASTIVPHSIDESQKAPAVVGAVGAGPHSRLVAQTTTRIAAGYGADAILVTMARQGEDDEEPLRVLRDVAPFAPEADGRFIRGETAADLIAALPEEGLLVLGAAGGSWWQRQFFGPGRRLMLAAGAGAIVVRVADRRCFHALIETTAVGAPMGVSDASAILTDAVAPVVVDRKLIGIVRKSALAESQCDATVADVMEEAVFVTADDRIEAAADLVDYLDGAPVPVVDDAGCLLGGVAT